MVMGKIIKFQKPNPISIKIACYMNRYSFLPRSQRDKTSG